MPKSSARTQPPTEIPWAKILQQAQQRFHIKRFRPGQRQVLESVFRGQDTLALMPTGAGKSLTYQLPALFLPRPVVVVSPLIALMQDQQEKAFDAEINVEKLNSTLRKAEADQAHKEIAEHEAQLIYVTPERLQSPEFLAELKAAGGISVLVVDEAHTIAQWGHDFRPAFLCIGEARRALGNPPVLALTATATEEVIKEILSALHAEDANIISTGVERGNLFFAVHPTVNQGAKLARIAAMLEEEQGTGIIYTASVRSANELHAYLTEHGHNVGHYHGQMPAREREAVQHAFMSGEHRIMIATKAFGLGIDKPDIRFVYHFEFPDSLETYYQEAGRAGRDGLDSHAVLLYRLEDKRIHSFFLAGRYPHLHELEAVYSVLNDQPLAPETIALASGIHKRRTQVILNLLLESTVAKRVKAGYVATHIIPTAEKLEALLQTYVDRAQRDKERLAEMMHYAETTNCRTQIIRGYFSNPLGDACMRCDNCAAQFPDQVSPELQSQLGATLGQAGRPQMPQATTIASTGSSSLHPLNSTHDNSLHQQVEAVAPQKQLIRSPTARFHKGDSVRHKRFGQGKVLDVHNHIALVDFLKTGQKRLSIDFLEAA